MTDEELIMAARERLKYLIACAKEAPGSHWKAATNQVGVPNVVDFGEPPKAPFVVSWSGHGVVSSDTGGIAEATLHIANCSPDQMLRMWRKDLDLLTHAWDDEGGWALSLVDPAVGDIALATARAYVEEGSDG